ncbi:MAG: alpha-galactosidase [Spirochaetes bacterium]|nr:MAG: alpha-galactosidase [Spirochaetota bacterium]
MQSVLFSRIFDEAVVTVHYKSGIWTTSEVLQRHGSSHRGRYFTVEIERRKQEYHPVLAWTANAPRYLYKMEIAFFGEIAGSWSFFKNGYQSWTVTRSYRPDETPLKPRRPWYLPMVNPVAKMQDNMNNLPSGRHGEISSESLVVLKNMENGKCDFAGVAGDFRDFVYFRANLESGGITHFAITYDLDNFELPMGAGKRALEPLHTAFGDEEVVLEDYCEDIRKRKNPPIPKDVPVGWCSWYYYFTEIKYADMLANLEVCKKKKLALDYFQVDDGWQLNVGDWLEMRPEFKDRMKHLADEIHKAGYKAGLWLAPFVATIKSNIFKRHPDWFIVDRKSLISLGKSYAGYNPNWAGSIFLGLDLTNPEAMAYVRRVIHTVVHEWGYDVIKLDFLYGAALTGHCRNNRLTRAERLLEGLHAIREEAGAHTFILGCGIPMMQGIGIVNGNRIGEDVAPNWIDPDDIRWGGESHVGTRNALRNTLNRVFMHRKFWLNDPDCLMIRDTDTQLTAAERSMLRDVICVSNGMLIVSDDMGKLPDAKIEEIRDAFTLSRALAKGRVYTLGVMDAAHPSWLLNTAGALLAMNFADDRRAVRLDLVQLERILARSKKKLPAKFSDGAGKKYTPAKLEAGVELEAHSALLLRF